jgi:hypothetical protein
MTGFESMLDALPRAIQSRAKRPLPVRAALIVRVVGRKPVGAEPTHVFD